MLELAAKVEASIEDTNSHKLKQGRTLLVSCPRGPMGGVAFLDGKALRAVSDTCLV